ncbi:MAG TPA: DUF488 domain-containing protein [bacterium]|nr:DUF488 domain-containing protein [bacterium]
MEMNVFTIGHSDHKIEVFISLIKQYKIDVVADVRSNPYSKYHPQFNRESLKEKLKESGVNYVFMGDELGARPKDSDCYVNGVVDFSILSNKETFKNGIARLIDGIKKNYKIAIMCSEKEPLDCHRTILVSKELKKMGVKINHILYNGKLEDMETTEKRLVNSAGLSIFQMNASEEEQIKTAYKNREREIYTVADNAEKYGE